MSKLEQQPSYTMTLADLDKLTAKICEGTDAIRTDPKFAFNALYNVIGELDTIRANLLDNSDLGEKRKP